MTNSIKKGHGFERAVVNILKERFNKKFSRVPASGAIATTQSNNLEENALKVLSGDIIVPKYFRFSIEVKSRKEFNFWNFFSENSEWMSWWQQAKREALESNRHPLLIVKYNNKKILAGIEYQLIKGTNIKFIRMWDNLSICLLSDLLSLNDNFFFMPEQLSLF